MRQMLTTVIAIVSVAALPTDQPKPTGPGDIAAALSKDIPAGWRCISDLNCIVIFREEEVTLLNPIGLPAPANMERDEMAREYGWKSQYMMVLAFRPRLSDEDYAELVKLRDAALRKIEQDSELDGKMKWQMGNEEWRRHPVPEYFNERFSIYVHRTDLPPLQVYPEPVAQERDGILAALSQFLKKYEDHARPVGG